MKIYKQSPVSLIPSNNVSIVDESNFPIVAIGAAESCIDSLEQFLTNLEPDLGLALVVIIHFSDEINSSAIARLKSISNVELIIARDGLKISKDKLYILPQNKIITIYKRKIIFSDNTINFGLIQPINIFFRSIATTLKDQAIGILFEGTGIDGVMGLNAIKSEGGLTFIQTKIQFIENKYFKNNYQNSNFNVFASTNQLIECFVNYVKSDKHDGIMTIENIKMNSEDTIIKILQLVQNRFGFDFTSYKQNTISRRIERRKYLNNIISLEEYYNFIITSPTELQVLYKELTIGVTRFYRDTDAFEIIRDKVIPDLIKNKGIGNEINVWVAGCSTGEEAYSLAMLFSDYLMKTGIKSDIKIFASDIDKESIKFAGFGVYPDSISCDVNDDYLKRFFVKSGSYYKISDSIRQMVTFATHDIIKDQPFSNIDFICCRNLLIYFQPQVQNKVLSSLSFSLNSDGILFLGSSESIGEIGKYFISVEPKWKIYKSKSDSKQIIIEKLFLPSLKS